MKLEETVSVITSCSLGGWNAYGQKGVMSMLEHWPKEITFHLVSEDTLPIECTKKWTQGQPNRLIFWNLNEYEPAREFYTRHATNMRAQGKESRNRSAYDFRLDAYRFSKKVFALRMVSRNMQGGRLLWLDADTHTLYPVPLELLRRLPPDKHHIAFLDRPGYHSECGFVGYNLNYTNTQGFLERFAQLYASDEVFKLKEWHDSWVFDWLRKHMAADIRGYAIPHKNRSHPFVYSELGQYCDHLKGNRKALGISTEHPRFKRTKG